MRAMASSVLPASIVPFWGLPAELSASYVNVAMLQLPVLGPGKRPEASIRP